MPRIRSSSTQCCLCSIGVFMFLGGIIMIATGASLCLNYNIIDEDLLIPELRNDEGKKIVGIILICVGLVLAIVSVTVSAYYLCVHAHKHPSNITPDDIKKLPNGNAKTSAASSSQRPNSNQSARSNSNLSSRSNSQPTKRKISPADIQGRSNEKSGSQFSQAVPNYHQRSKHKQKSKTKMKTKRLVTKTQLEDIKELDTISRKTADIDYNSTPDNMEETPRSQESDLDVASLNTSENSQVPVCYVTDHDSVPGIADNQEDSDDQTVHNNKNKQTMHHSHTSHDNKAFEDDITSTGSESTVARNATSSEADPLVFKTVLNDEPVQTYEL